MVCITAARCRRRQSASTQQIGERDLINQVFLLVFSILAIWCTQDRSPRVQRWGPVLGLLSQPFWFYATWQAEQMGMLVVCTAYTAIWAKGVYQQWLQPREDR